MLEFQVSKDDFAETRVVEKPVTALAENAVRLRIEVFALTSNNITYASMGGGELGYWDFFPAGDGFGCPPCWGFAMVEASNVAKIAVGARVYGYFPIGTHLDVLPAKLSAAGFFDAAPHRKSKSAVYNQYLFTAADPAYDEEREAEQCLFRPLYATGWWAADFIQHSDPAPGCVVFSSASAKTALATAHQFKRLSTAKLVGLTSARNEEYVRGTGLYDQVLAYEAIEDLRAEAPAVFVDFLGRDALTARIHQLLKPSLSRSVMIGATDWGAKEGGIQIPVVDGSEVTPEFFFVPAYASSRIKQDGEALQGGMLCDMREFYGASGKLVTPVRLHGADVVGDSWRRLLQGEVSPQEGLVHSW